MKKKISLVKWTDVCQPKDHGGLGIRRLKDSNSAFLMKIYWGLITKLDALWVKLMRGKFMNSSSSSLIPSILNNTKSSYLWKVICRVWQVQLRESNGW